MNRTEQHRTEQKNNKNKSKSKNKINQRIHGMQLSTPMAYDFHSFLCKILRAARSRKMYPQMNLTVVDCVKIVRS